MATRLGELTGYMSRLSNGLTCQYFVSQGRVTASDLNLLAAEAFLFWVVMIILSALAMALSLLSFCMTSRVQLYEERHGKVHLQPLEMEDDLKPINQELAELDPPNDP